ncbi:uncharacterized protein LOC113522673 [Galleria mellonella]|uniref:Uncharacterized protein LOC113522673 n=1 Tax=Galleria mellonella TaxID=7137 RepID=A0ABM3MLS4_GALME|nr:uncharacterized protein LOC113522673 [Galleria mellonella]
MEDLLQSQIKDSCKLALPEGLQDLMSDISREVLRVQPQNLCQFIARYLSALLVTRENLHIASRVCSNIYEGSCNPELEDELRYIGLNEEDVASAKTVIMKHFETGQVNEGKLMMKLIKETSIDNAQLAAVQRAVRNAFRRHQINNTTIYQSSSESSDEVTRAASHTLQLYHKTKPTDNECHLMTQKIQSVQSDVSLQSKPILCTVSSSSLAGSLLNLPKYKPYSVHDTIALGELDETPEIEHTVTDYTTNFDSIDDKDVLYHRRSIKFNNDPEILSNNVNNERDSVQGVVDIATDADDESEESIEEIFEEQYGSDVEYN